MLRVPARAANPSDWGEICYKYARREGIGLVESRERGRLLGRCAILLVSHIFLFLFLFLFFVNRTRKRKIKPRPDDLNFANSVALFFIYFDFFNFWLWERGGSFGNFFVIQGRVGIFLLVLRIFLVIIWYFLFVFFTFYCLRNFPFLSFFAWSLCIVIVLVVVWDYYVLFCKLFNGFVGSESSLFHEFVCFHKSYLSI